MSLTVRPLGKKRAGAARAAPARQVVGGWLYRDHVAQVADPPGDFLEGGVILVDPDRPEDRLGVHAPGMPRRDPERLGPQLGGERPGYRQLQLALRPVDRAGSGRLRTALGRSTGRGKRR